MIKIKISGSERKKKEKEKEEEKEEKEKKKKKVVVVEEEGEKEEKRVKIGLDYKGSYSQRKKEAGTGKDHAQGSCLEYPPLKTCFFHLDCCYESVGGSSCNPKSRYNWRCPTPTNPPKDLTSTTHPFAPCCPLHTSHHFYPSLCQTLPIVPACLFILWSLCLECTSSGSSHVWFFVI